MRLYESYADAERAIMRKIIIEPQFVTRDTFEVLGLSFALKHPFKNKNDRSNYIYAEEFFQWILSGDTDLSKELVTINPWVKRFTDTTGLPPNFSSSYGHKIKKQIEDVIKEVKNHVDSRRGYIPILTIEDGIIRTIKTTHEYPCTIGLQFFIREERLHLMVNMRSNNVYSVMPYDVYNFTRLQEHLSEELKIDLGYYYHTINSAHIYKGDARRLKETIYFKS